MLPSFFSSSSFILCINCRTIADQPCSLAKSNGDFPCLFLALKLGFRKRIRLFFDKLFLSIPYLNKFLVQVDLSRFLSSLSMLRNSNTPIIEAIINTDVTK